MTRHRFAAGKIGKSRSAPPGLALSSGTNAVTGQKRGASPAKPTSPPSGAAPEPPPGKWPDGKPAPRNWGTYPCAWCGEKHSTYRCDGKPSEYDPDTDLPSDRIVDRTVDARPFANGLLESFRSKLPTPAEEYDRQLAASTLLEMATVLLDMCANLRKLAATMTDSDDAA